jgi:hypothetical protein
LISHWTRAFAGTQRPFTSAYHSKRNLSLTFESWPMNIYLRTDYHQTSLPPSLYPSLLSPLLSSIYLSPSLSLHLLSNPSLAQRSVTDRTKRTNEPQSQSQRPTHGISISEQRLPATREPITSGSRAAERSSSRKIFREIQLISFSLFHSTNNSTKETLPATPGSKNQGSHSS